MGEIRMTDVNATGRIVGNPVQLPDGSVHFQLQALAQGQPFHCFAVGKAATNILNYKHDGDELSIEGTLEHYQFSVGSRMLIKVEFPSFGRLKESLNPEQALNRFFG